MTAASPDKGIVFNVQKYSVHDGPGIRTVVFLKGCPLRCLWCCNPESQQPGPELAVNPNKCVTLDACGRCLEVCPAGAVGKDEDGRIRIDRKLCDRCLRCALSCPSGALGRYGESMSVAQIIARVEEDGLFYSRSGGGLTLGGGDPLYQPEFTARLLAEARRRRIHTALETCGFVRWDLLAEACRHLDVLLYDIKSMDPEKHKAFTGKSNRTILENLKRVRQGFPGLPIVVRTPLIPGFNDSEVQIAAILERISTMPGVTYETLPYHRLGMPKYESLGRPYARGDRRPNSRILRRIRKLIDEFNQQKTAEGG